MSTKVPISRLPLPDSSRILTHNLTPDPIASNVTNLIALLKDKPTLLRKSRASDPSAHFSYMTPLPLPFPYRIAPPPPDITEEQRTLYIERVISLQEPLTEVPQNALPSELKKYRSDERDFQPKELLSLAPTCINDCFPQLDVGDALEAIETRSFTMAEASTKTETSEGKAARDDLVDVLSGDVALLSIPSSGTSGARGYAPWSLRYSGHQFGSWAGQLGDGRAISILETPLPSNPNKTYELQLKGAGRTPFSRNADGLAVLRSSVREYLVAEAMHALGIPTTRSLSLISLPTVPVAREEMETAAIVCRAAESFIRIGNFQALNSGEPDTGFIALRTMGGSFAQQPPHYEGLRILGEWVAHKVLNLDLEEGEPWARKLVWECARRNAIMVAGWQVYGFMHGVMNTDNISIMGLTIDYGPYAFMDVFDEDHICNHTDETGRYAYQYQPTMIVYALRKLLKSLGPIIGAEQETGKAVAVGWADHEKIDLWEAEAKKLEEELSAFIMETVTEEYWRLMRQRLALRTAEEDDHSKIFQPLLDRMQKHSMDFHSTFRILTTFRPSWITGNDDQALHSFINTLLNSPSPDGPAPSDISTAAADWLDYLTKYADRILIEQDAWSSSADWEAEREREGKAHNPRFVLRQWVLEEVISLLQKDAEAVKKGTREPESPSKGRNVLNKILYMATSPFEAWGAEGSSEALTEEEAEERRFCSPGPKKMMGFQCSCSS